jgi:hypothetical protein
MMATGIVRLRNTATNRYLAINQRGRLLLQVNRTDIINLIFHLLPAGPQISLSRLV